MKNTISTTIQKAFMLCVLLFSVYAHAEEPNSDILFKGIIKQSHDYSCGSAALSTLITGTIENSHVSEQDIINSITSSMAEEKGYSAADLAKAAIKLGYYAEWRKISKENLVKIKQPVLLLIGLNSEFPHYVVLKGIENNEAFLADPIRGNIRVPYEKLIEKGISEKYPQWYVMAIEASTSKPKDSVLYLSGDEKARQASHLTEAQSSAITLVTLSKEKQWIVDYGFNASLGNNNTHGVPVKSQNFAHTLNARYGITETAELGASIQYNDMESRANSIKKGGDSRQYNVYINNRFNLDDAGEYNLILGGDFSYTDQYDIFGGGVNATVYKNTEYAQIMLGGSMGKQFSRNDLINDSLPEYHYSGFIGANKPLGDRFMGSLTFSVSDAQMKNGLNKTDPAYSVSAGLSYVASKHIQISPSVGYSFGDDHDAVSFGMNFTYVGSW